jgi:hypothetical protein
LTHATNLHDSLAMPPTPKDTSFKSLVLTAKGDLLKLVVMSHSITSVRLSSVMINSPCGMTSLLWIKSSLTQTCMSHTLLACPLY